MAKKSTITKKNTAPTQTALALRLGWEIAEYYGRVRQHLLRGRQHDIRIAEPERRFTFSSGDVTVHQEIDLALQMIEGLAKRLRVDPVTADLLRAAALAHEAAIEEKHDLLGQLHEKLENWSQRVWTIFNVRSPQLSQACTAGGSLADTYWYASLPQEGEDSTKVMSEGPPQDRLTYLLQKGRMNYTIDRLRAVRDQFPPLVIPILVHSLKKWGVAEKVAQLSPEQQHRVYRNLESQARDWKNVITGRRPGERYLSAGVRSRIRLAAILVMSVVSLFIMAMFFVLIMSFIKAGMEFSQRFIFNDSWKFDQVEKIATFVITTIAAVAAPAITFLSRIYRWIHTFYHVFYKWITYKVIVRRTTHKWNYGLNLKNHS